MVGRLVYSQLVIFNQYHILYYVIKYQTDFYSNCSHYHNQNFMVQIHYTDYVP